jgi:hypothetical protein
MQHEAPWLFAPDHDLTARYRLFTTQTNPLIVERVPTSMAIRHPQNFQTIIGGEVLVHWRALITSEMAHGENRNGD